MDSPPRVDQNVAMLRDQLQGSTRFALAAIHCLANFGPYQIDHDNPSRSEHMDMRWRVIIRVDHDP
jgi:hypothetical protein